MGLDDVCDTGLVLGLGFSTAVEFSSKSEDQRLPKAHENLEPLLTLGICGEINDDNKEIGDDGEPELLYRQDSGTSSFSNTSVKRERDVGSYEEGETERVVVSSSSRAFSDEDDGKKKLRLNKDQSAVLEQSFKLHSTLNPKQKQDLAIKLNLRPRQVEVWFQNRRARTKLKQTEVDCEYLKKCCENLTEDNRRLQKELQELKALKLNQSNYYMHFPAATLSMCPSCERISGAAAAAGKTPEGPFSLATSTRPNLFNPFTNPSAAC